MLAILNRPWINIKYFLILNKNYFIIIIIN
jgi:hypothetical protein